MRTLGRLVSRHPWAVLLAWLLAAALSLPFAARAPAALTADPAGGLKDSEATRVTDLLRDRFGERDTNTVVLVTRSQPPLGTREGDATYQTFLDGLEDVPGVTREHLSIDVDGAVVRVQTVQDAARQYSISLYAAVPYVAGKAGAVIAAFVKLIEGMRFETERLPLQEMVQIVLEKSTLITHYQGEKEGADRIENLEQLVSAAALFL